MSDIDIVQATVLKLEPGDILSVQFGPEMDEGALQHAMTAFASCVKNVGLEGQVAVVCCQEEMSFNIIRAQ